MTQGPIRRLLEIRAFASSSANQPEILCATLIDQDDRKDMRQSQAICTLPAPTLVLGQTGLTVEAFLRDWSAGVSVSDSVARQYGAELYRCLFNLSDPKLSAHWAQAMQAASGRGLHLTLRLSKEDAHSTWCQQRVDALPFELLHDGHRFLFRQRGWNVLRRLDEFGNRPLARETPHARSPRVQVAWANVSRGTSAQPMADSLFSAHDDAVQAIAHGGRVERLDAIPMATRKRLAGALKQHRPDLLIWIGHGLDRGCGLMLHDEDDQGQPMQRAAEIPASDFAGDIRTGDVDIALLWSCHGAARGRPLEVGVAQALLDPDQGNVVAVLAAFSAIDASAAAAMSKTLIATLGEDARGDLIDAVNEARRTQHERELHWARPVLFLRTPLDEQGPELHGSPLPRHAMPPPERHWRPYLPPRTSYYFDHQHRLADLQATLREHQVVVLEGLPGIGKTELALAAMHTLKAAGGDVAWIDVTGHRDLGLLTQALGRLVRPEPFETREHLLAALRDLAITVVIDNAEDLLDDNREGLLALLDALRGLGPAFRLLLTSRHALGSGDAVTVERLHTVPVAHLTLQEARELFVASAGPRLAPEHQNAETLDPLLMELGGIARAIVLMAAQLGGGVDVTTLHRRLLEEGPRVIAESRLSGLDIPDALDEDFDKQRLLSAIRLSLQSAMAQAPEAEYLFDALGCFPAGLDQRLLPYVDTPWLGSALSALLRHHLVGLDGEAQRIVMAAPVRQVAQRRLQESAIHGSSTERLLSRLQAALTARVVALCNMFGGEQRIPALLDLQAEEPNLHQVLQWCLDRPEDENSAHASHCAMLALAESAYHGIRAREVLPSLKDVVERVSATWPQHHVCATAHLCIGRLLLTADDPESARQAHIRAQSIFKQLGDKMGEANSLRSLGDILVRMDKLDGAESSYSSALDLFREAGMTLGEANTLQAIGDLCVRTDNLERAAGAYAMALHLFRQIDNRLGEANTCKAVGDLHLRNEEFDPADEAYALAMSLYRQLEHPLGEANTFHSIGDLRLRTGNTSDAGEAYDLALKIFRSIQDNVGEANVLQSQGLLLLAEGRIGEAFANICDALKIRSGIHDMLGTGAAHGYLARVSARANALDHAIAHSNYAQRILSGIGDRYGRCLNLHDIGKALLPRKPQEGIACLLQAQAIASEIGDSLEITIAQILLDSRSPAADATDYAEFLNDLRIEGPALIKVMFAEAEAKVARGELDPYTLPPRSTDAGAGEPLLAVIDEPQFDGVVILKNGGPEETGLSINDRFSHPDAQEAHHDE